MQTARSNTRRIQIFFGLLLTLGVSYLPLGTWGERLTVLGPLLGHEMLWWLAVGVLLFYVLRVEGQPLSSIGLRRLGRRNLLFAIAAGIVMVVGTKVIYSFVVLPFHLQFNVGGIDRLMATPFWYRCMLISRAAVAEELLFRGYPIERLEELTGSRLLASAISWTAFTIAHHRLWGWNYLIGAGFLGVILTGLYLWRRNLPSNMIAHWIADSRMLFFY